MHVVYIDHMLTIIEQTTICICSPSTKIMAQLTQKNHEPGVDLVSAVLRRVALDREIRS